MDGRILQFVDGATNARISIISESASFQSEIAMSDRKLDAAGFIRTNRPPSKTDSRVYGTTKPVFDFRRPPFRAKNVTPASKSSLKLQPSKNLMHHRKK